MMRTTFGIIVLGMAVILVSQAHAAFFKGLGDIPSGFDKDHTYGMSTDGAVVVGCGEGSYVDEAFRWTFEEGPEGLGFLPGGEASCALDASADGSIIVGYSASGDEREAFRWTQTGGMAGLGDLPGGSFRSIAHAVSASGDVVVGAGHTASGEEAFIWIRGRMSNLRVLLVDKFGLELGGWTLTAAKLVSSDGDTIVGHGINPDGGREAWVANIRSKSVAPVLPAPTGLRIVVE